MNKLMGNKKAIAIFTLPCILMFTVMVFYPILQTIYYSLFNWDGLSEPLFCGIENYARLFQDPLFYQSMFNGFVFAAVLVVFQIGVAVLLAFALMKSNLPFKRFFRTTYFIPVVLSVTVVCQLWSSIYNPNYGLFNQLFTALGLDYQQQWLSSTKPFVAIIAVAFVNMWQCLGYQFAIVYAGCKSIPVQYREAALIDGATDFQLNVKIMMPLLKDTFRMNFIMAITGGLNAYAHVNLLTAGGPGTSSYTLTYMTFRTAFTIGKYGYGCAVAVALLAQCIVATMIINKLFSAEDITY